MQANWVFGMSCLSQCLHFRVSCTCNLHQTQVVFASKLSKQGTVCVDLKMCPNQLNSHNWDRLIQISSDKLSPCVFRSACGSSLGLPIVKYTHVDEPVSVLVVRLLQVPTEWWGHYVVCVFSSFEKIGKPRIIWLSSTKVVCTQRVCRYVYVCIMYIIQRVYVHVYTSVILLIFHTSCKSITSVYMYVVKR